MCITLFNQVNRITSMLYGFLLQKFCAGQMQDPETLLGCLDDNYDESSKKCQKALDADEEEDNEGMYLYTLQHGWANF